MLDVIIQIDTIICMFNLFHHIYTNYGSVSLQESDKMLKCVVESHFSMLKMCYREKRSKGLSVTNVEIPIWDLHTN